MAAADRESVLGWMADLVSDLVIDALDRRDLTRRLAAAATMEAPEFAAECLSMMRVIAESVETPTGFDRLSIPEAIGALSAGSGTRDAMLVLLAVALSIAGVRVAWPSRPAARVVRARMSEAGDDALAVASGLGSGGVDLYGWLAALVSIAVRVVSEIAANSVPVVRVETDASLPSTLLAYRLYGDAARAEGLVGIARSATPMLMPSGFDALGR